MDCLSFTKLVKRTDYDLVVRSGGSFVVHWIGDEDRVGVLVVGSVICLCSME